MVMYILGSYVKWPLSFLQMKYYIPAVLRNVFVEDDIWQ
jgi:hypothetical protein